jgi:hypothetical protein
MFKGSSRTAKALTALLFVGLGAGSAQAGYAIGGGPWLSQAAPLSISNGGKTAGQAYGEFLGYEESTTLGSILANRSHHRASGTSTNYRRGAYVSNQWWSNGNSCYVSSYDAATGAVGVSCNEGWNKKSEQQTGRSTSTNTWSTWKTTWRIDPTGSSGRVGIKVFIDVRLAGDPCSGTIYRGADY